MFRLNSFSHFESKAKRPWCQQGTDLSPFCNPNLKNTSCVSIIKPDLSRLTPCRVSEEIKLRLSSPVCYLKQVVPKFHILQKCTDQQKVEDLWFVNFSAYAIRSIPDRRSYSQYWQRGERSCQKSRESPFCRTSLFVKPLQHMTCAQRFLMR